jgi:hypothetical protein
MGPVGNYWWSGYPSNVSWAAWNVQMLQDQWAVRVAHHAPWLTHWWNSQKFLQPRHPLPGGHDCHPHVRRQALCRNKLIPVSLSLCFSICLNERMIHRMNGPRSHQLVYVHM